MALSSEQVEQHIAGVKKRITNERELKHHGYVFAKLCFQVKKYEEASRYLSEYLSVKDKDYHAVKLMGLLYETKGELDKAVVYYKRSLELKYQKDIVLKVAELYCQLDAPPVDRLKSCLKDVQRINKAHPMVLALGEKLQSLEGSLPSAVEELITKQLTVSPQDPSLHLRLVNLYVASGKLHEAYQYCKNINRKGTFADSLSWWTAVLDATERYYEELRMGGSGQGVDLLEVIVALLEAVAAAFELTLSSQVRDLAQCASSLLKYDMALFGALSLMRTLPTPPSRTIHHVALRELCGQLYLMAAKYLFARGQKERERHHGSFESSFQLGELCLLASLKTPLPPVGGQWGVGEVERWHTAARVRLSTAGGHLMLLAAAKGEAYLQHLPTLCGAGMSRMSLVKTLFVENQEWAALQPHFGSQEISFSLRESFLAADESLVTVETDLPSPESIIICNKVYVRARRHNLKDLLWLRLVHCALDMTVPTCLWMLEVFDGLRLDTNDLPRCEAEGLCVCDIEAFLVLLTNELEASLQSQSTPFSPRRAPKRSLAGSGHVSLSAALIHLVPSSLSLRASEEEWWGAVVSLLLSRTSAQEAAPLKRVVHSGLRWVRGYPPLQLSLQQLACLGRHFKRQAEGLAMSSDPGSWNYRDASHIFLRRSAHYWGLVCQFIEGTIADDRRSKPLTPTIPFSRAYRLATGDEARPSTPNGKPKGGQLFTQSPPPSPISDDDSALLEEAKLALALSALHKQDMGRALRLYSHVKTPQAAWNQSQIYLLLADQTGSQSPRDIQDRTSNLQKALDALGLALERLGASGDQELRDKLVNQREEVRQLLCDARGSPVAVALRYDDSPPGTDGALLAPRGASTPEGPPHLDGGGASPLLASRMELDSSLREALRAKDDQIAAMNQQLQQLRTDVEELKEGQRTLMGTPTSTGSKLTSPPPVSTLPTLSPGKTSLTGISPSGQTTCMASQLYTATPPVQPPLYTAGPPGGSPSIFRDGGLQSGRAFTVSPSGFHPVPPGWQPYALPGEPRFPLTSPATSALSLPVLSQPSALPDRQSPLLMTQLHPTPSTAQVLSLGLGHVAPFGPAQPGLFPPPLGPDASVQQPVTSQPSFILSQGVGRASPFLIPAQVPGIRPSTGTTPPFLHHFPPPPGVPRAAGPPFNQPPSHVHGAMVPQAPPTSEVVQPFFSRRFEPSFSAQLQPELSQALPRVTSVPSSFPMLSSLLIGPSMTEASPVPPPFLSDGAVQPPLQLYPESPSGVDAMATIPGTSSTLPPSVPAPSSDLSTLGKSLFATHTPVGGILGGLKGVETRAGPQEDEKEGGDESFDSNAGGDFAPIVSLPELTDLISGEEEEQVLFSSRAKLYRFDNDQWKDRGTGEMKILQHRRSGKYRLVMRRERILKLCCNHHITPGISLVPLPGPASDKSWMWFTPCDFADEVPKPEKFAIKFKEASTARQFKTVVNDCSAKLADQEKEKPSSPPPSPERPSPPPATSSLVSKLAPPPGTWSCDVCLVQNQPTDDKCVACGNLNPNPGRVPEPPSTQPSFQTQRTSSLVSKLAPPPGTWSCDVCLVQNQPTDDKCVACGNLNPNSGRVPEPPSTQPSFQTQRFPFSMLAASGSGASGITRGNTESLFPASGGLSLPSLLPTSSSGSGGLKLPPFSLHPQGTQAPPEATQGATAAPVLGGLKLAGLEAGGLPSFFQVPTSKPQETSPFTLGGLSLSSLAPPYLQPPSSQAPSTSQQPGPLSLAGLSLPSFTPPSLPLPTSQSGTSKPFVFTPSQPPASTAQEDPHVTSTGMGVPSFVLPTSKAPTFSFKMALPGLSSTVTGGQEQNLSEDLDVSLEREPDVYFKPIVSLPEVVQTKTGEEQEETLFSHRAKLYRFDAQTKQWKERGVGDIKILRQRASQKARVLMRRDQVLKICCNHSITSDMSLTSLSGSDKAWQWFTMSDFADEVAKPETLAVRFKAVETANEFKKNFENCIQGVLGRQEEGKGEEEEEEGEEEQEEEEEEEEGVEEREEEKIGEEGEEEEEEEREEGREELVPTPPQPAQQPSVTPEADSDVTITLVQMPSPDKVELATQYMLPPTFFNYETTPPCPGCRGCLDLIEGPYPQSELKQPLSDTEPQHSEVGKGEKAATEGEDAQDDSSQKSLGGTSLFSTSASGLSFAELAAGGSGGFGTSGFLKSSGSQSTGFSRAGEVLFSSGRRSPTEGDNYNPEEEADTPFRPLVTLPEVKVQTGEEDELVLFSHRAKLYRFDGPTKQWKERGVGDIKILHNKRSGKSRVLMRRDQIWKLCCNHTIMPQMNLAVMGGSDRAWHWFTPSDYADEVAKAQTLSVKFRHTETAQEFRRVFELALTGHQVEEAKEEDDMDSPVHQTCTHISDETVKAFVDIAAGSWSCGTCLVSNSCEVTQCIACGVSRLPQTGSASKPFIPLDPPKLPPASTQPYTSPSSSPPPAPVDVNSPIASCSVSTFFHPPISSPVRLHVDPAPPVTSHTHTSPVLSYPPSRLPVDLGPSAETPPPPHLPIDLSPQVETSLPPPPIPSALHLPIDLDLGGNHKAGEPSQTRENGREEEEDPLAERHHSQLTRTEEAHLDDAVLDDPEPVQKAEDLMLPNSSQPPVAPPLEDQEEEGEGQREKEGEEEEEGQREKEGEEEGQEEGEEKGEWKEEVVESGARLHKDVEAEGTEPSSEQSLKKVGANIFGSSSVLSTFGDLASQSTTTSSGFAQKPTASQFSGAGRQLFASATEAEGGADDPEREANIHFKPVATLPKTYTATSWDDNAEELFRHRGKLYRHMESQWKERGTGDMKIMRHKESGKVRLIMRRDQIFKLCCNHYITPEMSLMPFAGGAKAWLWTTLSDLSDLSDNEPKPEKLGIRFKHEETAQKFKEVFDECVAQLKQLPPTQEPLAVREPAGVEPDASLAERFKPAAGSWECEQCLLRNEAGEVKCTACGSLRADEASSGVQSSSVPSGSETEPPPVGTMTPVQFGSGGGLKIGGLEALQQTTGLTEAAQPLTLSSLRSGAGDSSGEKTGSEDQ